MNAAPDQSPKAISSQNNQFDLIVVGGASADTFLDLVENDPKWRLNLKTSELCFKYGEKITVESSQVHMGGNAQNVAVGAARLGYNVALVAEVGDDFYAEEIGRNLLREKVNTNLILHSPGKDTSHSVIMNLKGDRTLFSQHASHEHNFRLPPDTATRLMYLTSLGGVWDKAYQRMLDFAKTNQVPIAFNPGTRQLAEKGDIFWDVIKNTHILFLNLEEAKGVLKSAHPKKNFTKVTVEEVMEEMAALGPKIVVVTDGKNGSYARSEDGRYFEQGLVPATVVERTGAGDSYATGVIGAALTGKSLQQAMYWGAKNSASVVGRVGAEAGLLNRQQIEAEGDPLMVTLGSDAPLIILQFDHRTSLAKHCFNLPLDQLNEEQVAHLADDKMVVYEAFKETISLGLPQPDAAIAVDEQFGEKIIELANRENMAVVLPVEKSGKQAFEFMYKDFQSHIEKFKPSFVKSLVFYNPGNPAPTCKAQKEELKQLSDYCHQHGYKFLLEVITHPTKSQLEKVKGNNDLFNKSTLPDLRRKVINDFHRMGIEPDAWMFDYFDDPDEYRKLVSEVREGGRENVGIVISDYDATIDQILEAIKKCANIPGVIGYAAGSAVFWSPVTDYHKRDATRLQAKNRIAQEFLRLYQAYRDATQNRPQEPQVALKQEETIQEANLSDKAHFDASEESATSFADAAGVESDQSSQTQPNPFKSTEQSSVDTNRVEEEESEQKPGFFSRIFKR